MKNMMKRFLAVMLCLTFVLSAAPVKAKAAETAEAEYVSLGTFVTAKWDSSNANQCIQKRTYVSTQGFLEVLVTRPYCSAAGKYGDLYLEVEDDKGNQIFYAGLSDNNAVENEFVVRLGVKTGYYTLNLIPCFDSSTSEWRSSVRFLSLKSTNCELESADDKTIAYVEQEKNIEGYYGTLDPGAGDYMDRFYLELNNGEYYDLYVRSEDLRPMDIDVVDSYENPLEVIWEEESRGSFYGTFKAEGDVSWDFYTINIYNNVVDVQSYYVLSVEPSSHIPEGWYEAAGNTYYVIDGEYITGFMNIHNKGYYFNEDGTLAKGKGWIDLGGGEWLFNNLDGSLATGWKQISGQWYYFDFFGFMATNWAQDGDKWYYFGTDGAMKTGWQQVNGKWYYLKSEMKTGWIQDGGKWYYMGSDGSMRTGWVQVNGKWYYLNSEMKTGWIQDGGKWYYMNSDGSMASGWKQVNGKWYYLNSEMKTGWQNISNVWYFFGSDGSMTTGWKQISGVWYYFKSSGAMACSETVTIGGTNYSFDASGAWKS